MKALWPIVTLLLASLVSPLAAEPVVVVRANSPVQQLSHDEVVNIFLGRYRSLPGGETALPVDQPDSSALRAEFYRRLVNKNLNEINAYWSRLIFSGKTAPPQQAASAAEVLLLVTNHPGAVAYVERDQVDKRLRIVMEFSR